MKGGMLMGVCPAPTSEGVEGGVEKHLKGILRPVSQAIPPRPCVCLTKHLSKPTLFEGSVEPRAQGGTDPQGGQPPHVPTGLKHGA